MYMKKVLIFTFLSILMTSCSQKSSPELEWIPFFWESGTDWGKYIDKMSIFIPVTIDDLPHKFTMQLDLGTYYTRFYGNTLKPFQEKYPSLNNKYFTYVPDGWGGFSSVDLRLGEVVLKNIESVLYPNFGTECSLDTINAETEIHIGTIAPDLFQDKVLIIDYKLSRLAIAETLPVEYQKASFVKFKNDKGLIKIPFRINGKIEYLLFDTGASYFCLATTKQNAQAIGGTEIVDSLTATSWGNYVAFYGLETVAPVTFGGKIMDSSIVYYTEGEGFDDLYESENIWGLTGNGYFLNDVIIIDYKNNRLGINN